MNADLGDHHYRVYLSGYVFPALPAGTPDADVIEAAKAEADAGYLDVTAWVIEGDFDE